jgi:ankyrin repeat protein
MHLTDFFKNIASGDSQAVAQSLSDHPFLANVRNPDAEEWDASTPLHCAAKNGRMAMVKLLVENGAEVYTNPFSSYPPVIIAAWNKHDDIVGYFLNEIPEKAAGTNGLGVAINLAARQGWERLVKKHIEADRLSVHQRGWIGDTPLHWPAHNGYVEILELLIDAGADIEADEINWVGGKPLHWASEHKPESVAFLLKRGADVDSRNIKEGSKFLGFTPLIMNASQKNDCAEVTELLLDAGADLNAKDHSGRTALAVARETGLKRIPEVLLARGASQ